jgi:hypothetical protein
MFRPRNHIKLDPLAYVPNVEDLQRVLAEAEKYRSSTIELPWRLKESNLFYSLVVRAEFSPLEPVWTLYEGEGNRSHVIWSAPFTDLELLKEVISLTVAESLGMSLTSLPAQDTSTGESRWQEAEEEMKLEEKPTKLKPRTEAKETLIANQPDVQPLIQPPVQPPNQSPVPYAYFYPGYPYPIPYPYPYPYPQAVPGPQAAPAPQTLAGSIPLQPGQVSGLPTNTQNQLVPQLPQPNPELVSKQKNFMIGQLLIDTGLVVPDTLTTILKIQEMITHGLIDTEQAVEAVKKARNQQGAIEVASLINRLSSHAARRGGKAAKRATPLLGEILVKAEVINNSLLLAVLKLQEVVRSGAMTQNEACQAFKRELASGKSQKSSSSVITAAQQEAVVSLLVEAGLLSKNDKDTAYRVQRRHGGKIDNILAAAGKVSKKTFAAGIECERLLAQKKIKIEQVMIALNYCERSRVGLKEAIVDLGWQHDLDL